MNQSNSTAPWPPAVDKDTDYDVTVRWGWRRRTYRMNIKAGQVPMNEAANLAAAGNGELIECMEVR